MKKKDLKIDDVVQIDPAHDPMFGGCFMIVTEPKVWGAQGFINVLPHIKEDGKATESGRAYYRCKFENMEYVGQATWVHQRIENDTK